MITELAFIADKQANALAEGGQSDVDTPLEVQFDEFMDGGTISVMLCFVSPVRRDDAFFFSELSRERYEG